MKSLNRFKIKKRLALDIAQRRQGKKETVILNMCDTEIDVKQSGKYRKKAASLDVIFLRGVYE